MTRVIIVGAGSAGCVLAARLSEDPGVEVLLLEAGPDYATRSALPVDIADGTRLPSDVSRRHDWGLTTTDGVPLPRGRLVGGSSAVNGTFAMRGCPEDYDAWPRGGEDGWSSAEVFEVFRALESDRDFGDRPGHGSSGPVPIRRYRPEERSVAARAFLEAADAAGHHPITDHNAPGAVGAGPLPVNTLERLRLGAALTHLEPARARSNLTVRGAAPVDRVVFSAAPSTGMACAGGVLLVSGERVDGDLVVLCAGAYASPAILQRSGAGPAGVLSRHGVEVVVELPGVGRGLVDHPLTSVDVPVRPEPALRPAYQTMATCSSDGTEGLPDLHLFACGPFAAHDLDDVAERLVLCVGLVDPASRGRVEIATRDPAIPPMIDPGYLDEPADTDRLLQGISEARRLLATEPLASLVTGPELVPGPGLQGAALRRALPRLVRTYHHPVGTCAMGREPAGGAVVDVRGRVHGVAGLSVVDASIMPRIPRANTNLPTMMLAERLAARMRNGDAAARATNAKHVTR